MIKKFIKNEFDYQIKISRKFHLNVVTKIDYENCFQANFNSKYVFIISLKRFK